MHDLLEIHIRGRGEGKVVKVSCELPRTLPLKVEFWSIFPLACTYAVAEAYLIFKVLFGLRELNASAHLTPTAEVASFVGVIIYALENHKNMFKARMEMVGKSR